MSLEIGDKVRIATTPQPSTDTLTWDSKMNKLCGKIGTIFEIADDGDCKVDVPGSHPSWWYDPKWLTKVSSDRNKLLLLQV